MVCFTKYLLQQQATDAATLDNLKRLKPVRHLPVKRHGISEHQLEALLGQQRPLVERCILLLLASTGLRASELCAVTWADVDLQQQQLTIVKAKWGKTRKVGLNKAVVGLLQEYQQLASASPTQALFLNPKGEPLTRHGLAKRLQRIGKRLDVHLTPHVLRRAFVTINAGKGRSLVHLQRACGHSNIQTTMGYCLTAEQEVVEAMQGWE